MALDRCTAMTFSKKTNRPYSYSWRCTACGRHNKTKGKLAFARCSFCAQMFSPTTQLGDIYEYK